MTLRKVLDKGFVDLINHMGSDLEVVNDARVSFAKQSKWDESDSYRGVKTDADGRTTIVWNKLSDKDTKLIHYLAREGHWSPFAHQIIKLHIKAPIFVARQLFKHKVGFQENEVSRRYVRTTPEFYCPSEWRSPPEGSIKQGSGAVFEDADLNREWDITMLDALDFYERIKDRVAPELARAVLPQAMYTEWRWTGSLFGFARVFQQRASKDAQWESQQYAKAIGQIVQPLFPCSWEALTHGPADPAADR